MGFNQFLNFKYLINVSSNYGHCKVEDEKDIQNVPASVGGKVEETKPAQQDVTDERKPESTSTMINASELPPHSVLGMPALSPTMVRKF